MGELNGNDYFWPHDPGSIEEACFEVLNGRTIEYRHQWIKILIDRVKETDPVKVESDEWMDEAKHFLELGGCPVCFGTDEEGHKDGCEWGSEVDALEKKLAEMEAVKVELARMICRHIGISPDSKLLAEFIAEAESRAAEQRKENNDND